MAQTQLVLVTGVNKINAAVIHAAKKALPETYDRFHKFDKGAVKNPFQSRYKVTETFMNGYGNAAYVQFEW